VLTSKRTDLFSKKSVFAVPYKFAEFWLVSISPTFEYDAPHPHTTVPFWGMTGYPKKYQERSSSSLPPWMASLRRQIKSTGNCGPTRCKEHLTSAQCTDFSRSLITMFFQHPPHPRFSKLSFVAHFNSSLSNLKSLTKGTTVTGRIAPQPCSVFPSLLMWYTKNEIFFHLFCPWAKNSF